MQSGGDFIYKFFLRVLQQRFALLSSAVIRTQHFRCWMVLLYKYAFSRKCSLTTCCSVVFSNDSYATFLMLNIASTANFSRTFHVDLSRPLSAVSKHPQVAAFYDFLANVSTCTGELQPPVKLHTFTSFFFSGKAASDLSVSYLRELKGVTHMQHFWHWMVWLYNCAFFLKRLSTTVCSVVFSNDSCACFSERLGRILFKGT